VATDGSVARITPQQQQRTTYHPGMNNTQHDRRPPQNAKRSKIHNKSSIQDAFCVHEEVKSMAHGQKQIQKKNVNPRNHR
jgi:hypothetical protein